MATCILCGNHATTNIQSNASRTIYNCQSCGVFVLSDLSSREAKRHGGELSSFLTARKLENNNNIVLVSFEKANKDKDYVQLTVQEILSLYPRSFTRQMDLVLRNLTKMSSFAGEEIAVDSVNMCPVFYTRVHTLEAMAFIIKAMREHGLLEVRHFENAFFPCGITVSVDGWDRLNQMESSDPGRDSAVIYLPPKSSAFLETFQKASGKAVKECGYHVTLLGQQGRVEKVDYELIGAIKDSRFVICELSGAGGSGYYTAAMAAALDRPAILTCHQSGAQKLEIDTSQIPVLLWKEEKELRSYIHNAIRAMVL